VLDAHMHSAFYYTWKQQQTPYISAAGASVHLAVATLLQLIEQPVPEIYRAAVAVLCSDFYLAHARTGLLDFAALPRFRGVLSKLSDRSSLEGSAPSQRRLAMPSCWTVAPLPLLTLQMPHLQCNILHQSSGLFPKLWCFCTASMQVFAVLHVADRMLKSQCLGDDTDSASGGVTCN
jgi:hypothetical protein